MSPPEAWTLSGALNRALHDALAEDQRLVLFGEDVGRSGGVFRVTDGLQEAFGERRVFDTPVGEAAIAGVAVGLAFAGRPSVIEFQFDAFSYPALEQVIDHVAKMRERTRGRVDMPITIRIPAFGGIRGKEHHGESPETHYVHTAGLKVVVPSSPLDGYRLLRAAIDDPDPVVVLEPKARYWAKETGSLAADGPGIGVGRVLREGDACTVVTYGAMVARALEAADVLAGGGSARARRGPAIAVAPGRRPARAVRARDRPDRGGARGAPHPRDGRGDRRPGDGARLRSPGGAHRACHRLGRPLPTRVARGPVPARRPPYRRGGAQDGDLLMGERVFSLPDPGEGLTEAELIAWLVAEGDEVELNQPIAEVETSKAVVELPSPYSGRIARLHAQPGTVVAVGRPLVTFEVPGGDDAPRAEDTAVDEYAARETTHDADVQSAAPPGAGAARATPAVRKLARDLGVDIGTIEGSGPQGRVSAEDVRGASGPWAATVSEDLRSSREELTPVRRQIAENLAEQAAIPQATTFRTVDASALEAFRAELGVSPLPVVVAALCRCVAEHPRLNASWGGEHVDVHGKVNVGLAADTERGLVVPVLRDAGGRGIGELADEIRRLAAAAREGRLGVADMANATIAISNTGSYGSEAGTPILSPGTAVTMAIGVIAPRALVAAGAVVARPACTLSLTFDHRVLDGAAVGRALTDLVDVLQEAARLRDLPR